MVIGRQTVYHKLAGKAPERHNDRMSPTLQLTRRAFLSAGARGAAAFALLPGWLPGRRAAPLCPTAAGLDEKIGQMVLAGFRGLELAEGNPVVADLRRRSLGGVALFDRDLPSGSPVRNIASPAQLNALDTSLSRLAAEPLLIGIDQEGGQVARLSPEHGFPPSISQQRLGALDDVEATRQAAETTAQTLRAAGINLNLAPVVDLNLNPANPIIGRYERSFSADPDIVTRHALAVIRAHHRYGVLTTLKHFPGHGSSQGDSHLGFVDVTATWRPVELQPFRALIRAGSCDAIMTAHIFNAQLDPDFPATLSRRTVTGLLREQLGFGGVVISDDMGMGAIANNYPFETAVRLAIEAGVDILAYSNNGRVFDPAVPARAVAAIKDLVASGTVDEGRIDQSYRRIMRLKSAIGF